MKLLIIVILEGGRGGEGGRGREGRREREGGREGEGGSTLVVEPHPHERPTKCECLLASLIAICTLL